MACLVLHHAQEAEMDLGLNIERKASQYADIMTFLKVSAIK